MGKVIFNKLNIFASITCVVAAFTLTGCDGCSPEPSGAITGTVYYMQYQPLIKATVRTNPITTTVMTDNEAKFQIPNVRPGTYKIIAEYGARSSGSANVVVYPEKVSDVVVIVRPKSMR
ncbi:conserved hypothetical protein [Prosthecochloris aestuarii DSM 271]|uniref:Carboxypeptidase regulatory-like domain-containing protein n=1 Tax=Prosthecochloris aestuarii (strain DSM 271 / SK 413) TaxID=290512 RepID=B4S8G8_PROA2|nr:carboxypeptidase-like regulatory domain-containing protein [Prosthecochloris aestuarii]ACF46355.1 conserved hypothetical protein [Prosthecochloris aestuarii DSM 271]